MVYKIYHAIIKELILLKRDVFGLLILFIMPVVLILTITPIQSSVENQAQQVQIPILLINHDQGDLSKKMIDELRQQHNFKIIKKIEGHNFSEKKGKTFIRNGRQQILMIIPPNFSNYVTEKVNKNVQNLLKQVMPGGEPILLKKQKAKKEIKLYFDPIIGSQIKKTIQSAINSTSLEMETDMIYKTFEEELNADLSFISKEKLIQFKEHSLNTEQALKNPTPVQHNTPAWTLVAIFLIIIPLASNLVKEKNGGTYIRLKTLPVRPIYLMVSKIIVFLLVCMIQFYLMLLVSIYVFPLIDLPALEIDGKLFLLTIVALFSGIAAIGFGILIGTIAKTHEQAAPFGAMSVVILAALGGLWFPVYAMSESMQNIALISPMNWGLEAFYKVLIRNGNLNSLLPYLGLLLLFFIINITLAVLYEKKINRI